MKLKEKLVELANAEWVYFGNQTGNYIDEQGKKIPYKFGHREDENPYYLRVGKYWKDALGYSYDGHSNLAWSAAFISYLMKTAGLSAQEFKLNEQHSKYIRKAILAKQSGDLSYAFWGYRLSEYAPQVGDLICYLRDAAIGKINYDSNTNDYPSHTDLVIEKTGNLIKVIGGNVGDSVTKKILHVNDNGILIDSTKAWFVVLKNNYAERELNVPVLAAEENHGSKYLVTGDGVRLRPFPSKTDPTVLDSMFKGDSVIFFEQSSDKLWSRVSFKEKTGWMSSLYLKPESSAAENTPIEDIKNIVLKSPIIGYSWKDRGRAPVGYYQGMALMFVRLYCRLKNEEKIAVEIAKPAGGDPKKDSLKHYETIFENFGMDNEAKGADTLRHLFVLMAGLGMRESSGRHCVGRDTTADNTTSETAEAGLFQTSYNSRNLNPLLKTVFDNYRSKPDGFVDVFSAGVTCGANNWDNYGEGEGKDFQKLSKECPGFAVEYTALALRNTSLHWGPIKRREAEIKTECDLLFLKLQQYVDLNKIQAL